MKAESRMRWIDSWKGILIFLVVLGHAVGMMCHYTTGETSEFMSFCYKWIYLFHMPAFFVVVGFVLKSREVQGVREVGTCVAVLNVARKGMRRLLVPYFFWGTVSAVAFLGMTVLAGQWQGVDRYYGAHMLPKDWWQPFVSLLHAGGWPRGEGFRCNSVLWFLPVMFLTLCVERGLRGSRGLMGLREPVLHGAMVVVCLVVGGVMRFYVGALPWGIDRVSRFLAFVYVGKMIASGRFEKFERFERFTGLGRLGWVGVFAVCAGGLTWGAVMMPGLGLVYRSWQWYFIEAGLAVVGSVMTLALARIVDCRVFAGLGLASLGIMLMHKFPIVALQQMMGRLTGWNVWMASGTALVVAVAATVLAWGATVLVRRYAPLMIGENRRSPVSPVRDPS